MPNVAPEMGTGRSLHANGQAAEAMEVDMASDAVPVTASAQALEAASRASRPPDAERNGDGAAPARAARRAHPELLTSNAEEALDKYIKRLEAREARGSLSSQEATSLSSARARRATPTVCAATR